MKSIRIGNDIAITWTIANMPLSDLGDLAVALIGPDCQEATITSSYETVESTNAVVWTITFYGKDQTLPGVYRLLMKRNEGAEDMNTLDEIRVFELVPLSAFGIVSGSDTETVDTVTLDVESSFNTSTGGIDPEDYYTKTQTDALLANKENTLTFDETPTEDSDNPVTSGGVYTAIETAGAGKQDSLDYYDENTSSVSAAITTGHASLAVESSDGGTITATATHVSLTDGDTQVLVGGATGVTVTTPDGIPFIHNGSEVATASSVATAISGKQDTLTFDDEPQSGSSNPVKSDGIYDALQGKEDTINWDATPTAGSQAAVRSTGIKTYVDNIASTKQDALSFDSVPTNGSTNPVYSGGVYSAIAAATNVTGIVSVASGTTSLSLEAGKYYRIAGEVSSLALTLPTITGATSLQFCVVKLTTASSTSVTFTAADTINYFDGYSIDASSTYELNCLWNGSEWVVAFGKIATS